MTIAKNFASKAAVAFVAVAMLFTMMAPAAQAQSSEDLQAMINTLLAQIAALQSQVGQGGTSVASGICPYTWTRDLNVGATGADVMKLQQFLNANADTRVAASGAGSVGAETEFYGPATAAAVSKMQVMYRADILTPAGLVNPTGYFGPSTRAKANALCVTSTPTTPVDGEEEEEEEGSMDLSGEASLDNFEVEDGESSIEEGDTDVVVAEVTVEFADGDASISRLDFMIVSDEAGAEPWEAFETFSLWVDGEMVAEMDASDEDDYLDEDDGTFRFSGLDIVAMEDDELEILVGASVQNNLDDEELDGEWTVTAESMRFFDADGVATTETSGLDGESNFDIDVAGADEEIDLSLASSNPDATDIVVDTDTDTNDVTIMVADIAAEDNDIELNKIVVLVETGTASTSAVVDEVRVVIDGESFDAETVSDTAGLPTGNDSKMVTAAGTSTWYVFDIDGDVVIDEDDEVQMEVVVDFKDTDDGVRYANGTTIKASVTSVERGYWEAEGAEDLDSTQFGGTAVGDTHTLVAEGILVPVDGFSSETDTLGQDDNIGEFTLEFEVSAVEGDFYITELATTTDQNNGVRFSVTNAGDADINGILTSTADEEDDGVFVVREGETETFTLTVTVSGASTVITPRVTLTEVNYTDEEDGLVDGGATVIEGTYLPTPASDFRTNTQTVQATA